MRPSAVLRGWSMTLCLAALLVTGSTGAHAERIDVNHASEAQLDSLNGLGPATTRRILAERDKAPFKSWQDLLARVKGLGPSHAAKLSAQGLAVEGQAYRPKDKQAVNSKLPQ